MFVVGLGILLAADKSHLGVNILLVAVNILPVAVDIHVAAAEILPVADVADVADTLLVVAGILVAADRQLPAVGILPAVGTLLVAVVVVHRKQAGVDYTHHRAVHNRAVRMQLAHSSAGKNNHGLGDRQLDYSWQADGMEERHQFVQQPSHPLYRRMGQLHLALILRTLNVCKPRFKCKRWWESYPKFLG
jgi:hypothetical protein